MLIPPLLPTVHIHPKHDRGKKNKTKLENKSRQELRTYERITKGAKEPRIGKLKKGFGPRQVNEVAWPRKETAPWWERAGEICEEERLREMWGGGCGAIVHDFRVICYSEAWKEPLQEYIATCQPGREPSALCSPLRSPISCQRSGKLGSGNRKIRLDLTDSQSRFETSPPKTEDRVLAGARVAFRSASYLSRWVQTVSFFFSAHKLKSHTVKQF